MRRLALRYQLGLEKYTRDNWRKGLQDPAYIDQAKCHLMEHVLNYMETGCTQDDELAAAVWNAFFLMEAEKHVADQSRED